MSRLACLFVLLFAALATPALAQTTIVAVVNGKPITTYDVGQRQRLLKLTGAPSGKSVALEELIDEQVQLSAASRSRVSVPKEEVDDAIATIAKRVKLSPSQLASVFKQAGINIQTLRDRLEAQIAFNRLTRARFASAYTVTEQELVAALLRKEGAEKEIDTFEYDLHQVTVAMPSDPSPSRLSQAKQVAQSVRSKFNGCPAGLTMARGTRDVVVQPFGRRTAAELPRQVAEKLEDVDEGKLSEPIESSTGLVMFAVCKKTPMRSTNAAMKALQPEMQEERGKSFAKQYLRQLRRDAVIEIR